MSITTSAYFSSSGNYRLQSDSLNMGGILSTSTNYYLEDTLGEVATGISTSTVYDMNAGYQQMQRSVISVSAASDINMPELSLTQNTGVGSTTWTITTDSPAGYSADVYTIIDAACPDRDGQGAIDSLCDSATSESFADISISKHLWSVVNEYSFGWSAHGDDVSGFGPDNTCLNAVGVSVPSGGLLWQGFNASTLYQIASSTQRTGPNGTDTTLCLAIEQDTVLAPSGDYTANIVITAVSL